MFKMPRKENKTRQTNKQTNKKRLNKSEMALEEKEIFQMICTVKINKTIQQNVQSPVELWGAKWVDFLKIKTKHRFFF